MTRYLISVLLFLLPFIVYFLYLYVAKNENNDGMSKRTFGILIGVGVVFVAGFLFYMARFDGAPAGSVYHPPQEIDGRIVPGYFE